MDMNIEGKNRKTQKAKKRVGLISICSLILLLVLMIDMTMRDYTKLDLFLMILNLISLIAIFSFERILIHKYRYKNILLTESGIIIFIMIISYYLSLPLIFWIIFVLGPISIILTTIYFLIIAFKCIRCRFSGKSSFK